MIKFTKNTSFILMALVSLDVHSDSNDKFIGSVPRVTYDLMKKHQCELIDNFYENYLIDQPPFLKLGNIATIFVCQYKNIENLIKYKLVFEITGFKYHNGAHHEWYAFKNCPPVIESNHKYGGLSISIEHREFEGKKKKHLTLTIGKDGGFTTYVCYNSKWRIGSYH